MLICHQMDKIAGSDNGKYGRLSKDHAAGVRWWQETGAATMLNRDGI